MYKLTCPSCGYKGTTEPDDFDISLADEVFCPKCGWNGILEDNEEEDEYADE